MDLRKNIDDNATFLLILQNYLIVTATIFRVGAQFKPYIYVQITIISVIITYVLNKWKCCQIQPEVGNPRWRPTNHK